jgi:glycosyltransferase involved in cell wall biosynthesis
MATLLLFQRFPQPVVVTVLDIIPHLVRHNPQLRTYRHPVDALFYRLALLGLRRADVLIAISEYTKRTLVEGLGLPCERIHVIYPAIDPQRFRPLAINDTFRARYELDPQVRYVLYVGSDDPRKNLPTLVRSFGLLRQRVNRVQLLVAGSSQFIQERERLKALVAELGLQEHVRFLGRIPDDDLPAFYNASAVVVLPSYYEGFGYPVVEAMACGRPVIAANTTSLPEVVGNAGLLFEPDDVDGLANGLHTLLTDVAEAERIGKAGLERANSFASDQLVNAVIQVYRTI